MVHSRVVWLFDQLCCACSVVGRSPRKSTVVLRSALVSRNLRGLRVWLWPRPIIGRPEVIVFLFVIAAAAGATIRWVVTTHWQKLGTWSLNTTGAWILGLLASFGDPIMTVIGTAGIGAMTTVSGLVRELADLLSRSRLLAGAYFVATLLSGVLAAWVGIRWGFS